MPGIADRLGRLLAAACLAAVLAACAPTHEIKAYPNYIQAGVQPGDRVKIRTTDGRQLEFEVDAVDTDKLSGEGVTVAYSDIAVIERRSWSRPDVPCGGSLPLGCSVPEAITSMSDYHAEYARRFDPACVNHDYCYRHGAATYGHDQQACDTAFRDEMRAQCAPGFSMKGMARVATAPQCYAAAQQMYEAVKLAGKKHFRTATSTYCEYDGPP